jgi:hypothetical protein
MSDSTGGPAFPIPGLHEDSDFNGMTLRDFFAAHVSIDHGHVTDILIARGHLEATADDIAKVEAALRYNKADAMLAERSKP